MSNLSLKAVLELVDKATRPLQNIVAGSNKTADALNSSRDALRALQKTQADLDSFKRLQSAISDNNRDLEQAESQLEALKVATRNAVRPNRELTRELEAAKRAVHQIKTAQRDYTGQLDTLRSKLQQAGISSQNFSSKEQQLRQRIDQTTAALRRQQSAIDQTAARMKALDAIRSERMESMGRFEETMEYGATMTALGAAAAVTVLAPVNEFAKAEDAATNLKISMMGIGGVVAPEFKQINELATRLGGQLPGTTADFQLMMAKLVQQGISYKDILGGVGEASANLAVLLKMPFEDAAVFAAKMQEATKTTEKDMLGLMDTIQRTNYLGIDPSNMLSGFSKISSGMKTIRQEGLEGAKAMAPLLVMADQSGMEDLSSAGNAYSKVFASMLKTDNIKKTLDALKKEKGVRLSMDFTDGKGEFGGLENMYKQLEKMKGLSTAAKNDLISGLFGNDRETIQVLNVLIDKGKAGYDETIAKMQAQADLQTRVNAALGTVTNLWDAATGSLKNAFAAIGASVETEVKDIIKWITETTASIQEWAKANPETANAILKTIAAFAAMFLIIGSLTLALSALAHPFIILKSVSSMLGIKLFGSGTALNNLAIIIKNKLLASVWSLVASLSALNTSGTGLGYVAAGIRLIGNSILFAGKALLTNPVFLAIAVAALLIIKFWQPIKAFFKGLWAGLVAGLEPVRATFSTVFDSFAESLAPLKPLWDIIVDVLGAVFNALKWLITPFQATSGELANATTYGHAFGLMLADVINFVVTLIAMILHLISFGLGALIKYWQLVFSVTASVWQGIVGFFSSGIGNISAAITNFSPVGLFQRAFSAVLSWFGIELPAKFTAFGAMIIDGLKNGISNKIASLKATLTSVMQGLPDWAKKVLDIHSPSRVFAQIGGYTMQGLEQGLLSGAAMPINAIGRTSGDMIKALDTSQIKIDRRPPLTAAAVGGRAGSQAAPITLNMTINAPAGMDTQQLAQLVAAEVAKATRPASNRGALYDTE